MSDRSSSSSLFELSFFAILTETPPAPTGGIQEDPKTNVHRRSCAPRRQRHHVSPYKQALAPGLRTTREEPRAEKTMRRAGEIHAAVVQHQQAAAPEINFSAEHAGPACE